MEINRLYQCLNEYRIKIFIVIEDYLGSTFWMKYFIIGMGTLFLIIWAFFTINNEGAFKDLDPSWEMGLVAAYGQNQLAGRDIFFTYGPLYQFITYEGSQINLSNSPYDENVTSRLLVMLLTILIFSICLLLIKPLSNIQVIFIIFGIWLTGMIQPMSIRVITGLLGVIVYYYSLTSVNPKKSYIIAILAGGLAFAAQLLTFEAGVYTIFSYLLVTIVSVIFITLNMMPRNANSKGAKRYIDNFVIALGSYLIANLLISFFYKISSTHYLSLFEYQIRSLEIISVYSRNFGYPWILWKWGTISWFTLLIGTLIFSVMRIKSNSSTDRILYVSLLVYSLILVKSAITRAEPLHLIHGTFAIFLTFLLLGKPPMKFGYLISWSLVVIFFASTWIGSDLYNVYFFKNLVLGRFSFQQRWTQLLTANNSFISPQLGEIAYRNPNKPLLAYPYQNYISIITSRNMVAPFLQTYAAGSVHLQEEYINELSKYPENFEIIYGIDQIASWQVDNVQTITRTPIIFEYIYNNFILAEPYTIADGYFLLEKNSTTKQLKGVPLSYSLLSHNGDITVSLDRSSYCSLLKIDLAIKYPLWSVVGYSVPIHMVGRSQSRIVSETNIVALSEKGNFETFVNLLPADDFPQLFGNGYVPKQSVDQLEFYKINGGIFGVQPESILINSVECVSP